MYHRSKRREEAAGSALLPLLFLACFSGRLQHTQQALGDFLLQEILPELTQRLIELGVTIVRRGPGHRRGLAILGQGAISRDCRARLVLPPFDDRRRVLLSMSDTVPQQLAPTPYEAYDNDLLVNKFPAQGSGEIAVVRKSQRCGLIEG
jgi:hypothetical protein